MDVCGLSFCWNCVVCHKNECVGATESGTLIDNCDLKGRNTTECKLHKIWRAVNFLQNCIWMHSENFRLLFFFPKMTHSGNYPDTVKRFHVNNKFQKYFASVSVSRKSAILLCHTLLIWRCHIISGVCSFLLFVFFLKKIMAPWLISS